MALTFFPIVEDTPRGLDAMTARAFSTKTAVAERKGIRRATVGGPVSPTYTPKPETELRRRSIRHTAARMIAECGVLRATMQGITRALHLRGMSIYYHYSSREELLADIMISHLTELTDRVCAAMDATEQALPRDRLCAMVAAFLAFALEERNEHRLMLRSGDILPEQDRLAIRSRFDVLSGLFRDTLHAAGPHAGPGVASVVTMSLLAAASCAVLWFDPAGRISVDAYAETLTEMALAGMRAEEEAASGTPAA